MYEIVIGLEIHCELATKSKIFCSCPTSFKSEENENVCPICLGMPGTLPKLNEKVVEYAVMAGLALNCEIARDSKLDRKNYFYPDLPKAYQISQYDKPLCVGGYLTVTTAQNEEKKIGITRIHIEEDAGKLVHMSNSTLLDNNRCGVPLIEIVTEPDMRSETEALDFAKQVKSIMETIGVSDCKMQEGSIRFDVNLSVHKPGEPFGTRTEMKNLNSFRALTRAIEYESRRQISAIENGETIIQQTRRWDDDKGVSYAMRSKEDAHDYRYFPDPDLVNICLSDEYIKSLKNSLPMLPKDKIAFYTEKLGLSVYEAEILTSEKALCELFEQANEICANPKSCVNFIIGDLFALSKGEEADYSALRFTGKDLGELIKMTDENTINLNTARKVFSMMYQTGQAPKEIVENNNLAQMSDTGEIQRIVEEVIRDNPQSVADILSGKNKAMGFLIGQIMKKTSGKANPAVVTKMVNEKIDELK